MKQRHAVPQADAMLKQFRHIGVEPLNTNWQPRVHIRDIEPPRVPPEILQSYPRLHGILTAVGQPSPLYWETWPPDLAAVHWGWTRSDLWPDSSQLAFDKVWPGDGDDWVDSLIDEYGSNWHNALPLLAVRDQPELVGQVQSALESQQISALGPYAGVPPRYAADLVLKHGPWVRTAKRRSWRFPSPAWCDVCGIGYYADTIRYYLLRRWGGTSICPRCLSVASFGIPYATSLTTTPNQAIEALRELAATARVVPPQAFRERLAVPGLDPSSRVRLIAALVCVPDANTIREALGGIPWLQVLQRAELVGDAWRPARGTLCTARDGHPCRSLAERSIDDWLSSHSIAHEVEPAWPKHGELNPSGKLRGDWRLHDGTFVEYAGLDHTEYTARIELKRRLALQTGTRLVIILPEDLPRLGTILAPWGQ